MGYPAGAGPEAGRFGSSFGAGMPSYGQQQHGQQAAVGSQFPTILPVQAVPMGSKLMSTLGTPGHGRGWLVQRITVSCSTSAVAYVYVGGRRPEHLVSGTPAGSFDEHDAARLIPVPPMQKMYVIWEGSGLTAATAWARIEYWEVPA